MKNSFSFLAKHISWKYIVLILILIYIILLTVPYLPHKTVSEEYKEKMRQPNIIPTHPGQSASPTSLIITTLFCIGSV